jgi:hypothetical protein
MNKTTKLKKLWRKYGAFPLFLTQVLAFVLGNPFIAGIGFLACLTIPCGIKMFNKKRWLWHIRQLCFLIAGIFLLLVRFI